PDNLLPFHAPQVEPEPGHSHWIDVRWDSYLEWNYCRDWRLGQDKSSASLRCRAEAKLGLQTYSVDICPGGIVIVSPNKSGFLDETNSHDLPRTQMPSFDSSDPFDTCRTQRNKGIA